MSESEAATVLGKRERENGDEPENGAGTAAMDDDDDDDIGPMPMPDSGDARKKRKGARRLLHKLTDTKGYLVLPHEKLFLDHMPSADRYSKSFMHRDVINFVTLTKYACARR